MVLKQYAPAKLTLTLRTLDKRDDGYNNLEALTVFLPDICDIITLDEEQPKGIFLNGDSKQDVAIDENNLVNRAFETFSGNDRISDIYPEIKDLHVELEKNIPIAAGLGGGSADAAAMLNALNRYCGDPLTITELGWMAQELGSDVPGCIYSQALWMRGVGDIVEPLEDFYTDELCAVVVTPETQCSTPEIYRHYDAIGRPKDDGSAVPTELGSYVDNLHNDLALAAYDLFPELTGFKEEIQTLSGLEFMLAGSGSTFFALTDSLNAAVVSQKLETGLAKRDLRLLAVSQLV